MSTHFSFKDFVTMYLKNSPQLKEDQFESEISSKVKLMASKPESEKELLEYVFNLEELRKTPDVNVRRLITLLTIISFGIVV